MNKITEIHEKMMKNLESKKENLRIELKERVKMN
jgi:hypothetical protein